MAENAHSKEKIPLRDRIRVGLALLLILLLCWLWMRDTYIEKMDFLSVALGIVMVGIPVIIAGNIYNSSWRDYLHPGWIRAMFVLVLFCTSAGIISYGFVTPEWVRHGLSLGMFLGLVHQAYHQAEIGDNPLFAAAALVLILAHIFVTLIGDLQTWF